MRFCLRHPENRNYRCYPLSPLARTRVGGCPKVGTRSPQRLGEDHSHSRLVFVSSYATTPPVRETVQACVKRDAAFRKGLLSEAIEGLLSGEVLVGKELLRDYINAAVGFPKLAAHTKIHVKTLQQMFGPNGNPTAKNLFDIVAY